MKKKIALGVGILAITAGTIFAVSFPVHGTGMLNYKYNIPGNGNGIGTPIMQKTQTSEQTLNVNSCNRGFRIRLRDKKDNGRESTLWDC